MSNHTRERILTEALDLFSARGYAAVSVRDIARATGIKESSLYNHFPGKQAMFDSLVQEYSERGNDFFQSMKIIGEDKQFSVDDRTVDMYRGMNETQFTAIAGKIFAFYFLDETNVKLRKLLTIEQYRSPELAGLYRKLSFDEALEFQVKLFAALSGEGLLVKADPFMMALAWFSPIFLMFCKYDANEQGMAEAKELFQRHIAHFMATYGVKSNTSKPCGEGNSDEDYHH